MLSVNLIHEIQKLPLDKKFWIVEETIKSIKKEETDQQLSFAATELYDDYMNDEELISFTELDLENFYETK